MVEKKVPSGRKGTAAKQGKGTAQSKPGDAAADPVPQGSKSDSKESTGGAQGAAKAGQAKPATAKVSAAKSEAAKSETAKSGAVKPDAVKPAAVKTDATKSATRPDASNPGPSGPGESGTAVGPSNATAKMATSSIPASGARPAAGDAPATLAQEPPDSRSADAKPTDTRAAPAPSKTPPHPSAQPQTAPPPRKGGFLPLLLGGVLAAAIGFGAAYYLFPQLGITPAGGMAASDISAKLDQQADRIDTLAAQIDALPAPPDISAIEPAQSDMAARISDLSEQVSALASRVEGIEALPTSTEGSGVTSGQLGSLRQTLKAQGDEIAALIAEADSRDDAARAAAHNELRRAALTRIRTALDTGSPFASALGDLERAGMSAPDALQEVARTGVMTQAALQDSFAPAARAALAEARESGEANEAGGFWAFMSDQFGARSLGRREGPGTDAVLSRAEDDLRQGKLDSALREIEALPDATRAEMSDWADSARARMQALAALAALDAKLN